MPYNYAVSMAALPEDDSWTLPGPTELPDINSSISEVKVHNGDNFLWS